MPAAAVLLFWPKMANTKHARSLLWLLWCKSSQFCSLHTLDCNLEDSLLYLNAVVTPDTLECVHNSNMLCENSTYGF